MQGRGTKRFVVSADTSDLRDVLREANQLLAVAHPCERIDLSLQICITLENMGAHLETADYAAAGVYACEQIGVDDERYAALLRGLGRGLYYRQLYDQAAATYTKLYDWAVENGNHRECVMALYSVACCKEKAGPLYWPEAVRIYNTVFASEAADWPHKLAATVNQVNLLMNMGRDDTAYELATTRFLHIPQDEKKGTPWIEFLVLMARSLIEKGDVQLAETVINDALDALPENRPVTAAKAHAVYGLVMFLLGDSDEALDAVELAWAYAEMVPTPDAYQLIHEIERRIRG